LAAPMLQFITMTPTAARRHQRVPCQPVLVDDVGDRRLYDGG
jgi:hypothetical protein